MLPLAQNVAVGATVAFLAVMVLRQVPVLGFFVRLGVRSLLLVSPIMLVALVAGLAWFHGASLVGDGSGDAATSPLTAPLPTGRPGG